MSEKRIISNNIKYNAIGQAVVFAVELFLFPFIVSNVGKEIYGVYLLVMAFTGYLGVLEFGVTAAVTKYVAELSAKGEREEANKIVSASFSLYLLIGLAVAVILFLLSFFFDRIFSVNPENIIIMRQLFWVSAAASFLIWPAKIFERVLEGFQRFDLLSFFNIAGAVLTGISAIIIFKSGLGIVCFLIFSYIFIILKSVIAFLASRFYFLKTKILFPYFDRAVFKTIFSFSIFLFLSNLVGLFIFDFDSFVIGAFVSVSAITLYGVAYNLQRGFRVVNGFLGAPLFSAAADMEGKGAHEKQKSLLLKGTRYMTLIFVPMAIITIVFSSQLINSWMGPGFFSAVLPAQILITFWIFNNTVEVGSSLIVAKGHVKAVFKIVAINAFLNVVLSLFLVKPLGILGVALGTTLPMVLVYFPMILQQIMRILKITLKDFFNFSIKKNLGAYLLSFVLPVLAVNFFKTENFFLTAAEMVAIYLVVILISFAVFFSAEEKKETWKMIF